MKKKLNENEEEEEQEVEVVEAIASWVARKKSCAHLPHTV